MPITTDVVELESWSGRGVQHYVIKFVSGFLWVLRFPPPLKLTATNIAEILLKVALNTIKQTLINFKSAVQDIYEECYSLKHNNKWCTHKKTVYTKISFFLKFCNKKSNSIIINSKFFGIRNLTRIIEL